MFLKESPSALASRSGASSGASTVSWMGCSSDRGMVSRTGAGSSGRNQTRSSFHGVIQVDAGLARNAFQFAPVDDDAIAVVVRLGFHRAGGCQVVPHEKINHRVCNRVLF